jgi:hypothetical protein
MELGFNRASNGSFVCPISPQASPLTPLPPSIEPSHDVNSLFTSALRRNRQSLVRRDIKIMIYNDGNLSPGGCFTCIPCEMRNNFLVSSINSVKQLITGLIKELLSDISRCLHSSIFNNLSRNFNKLPSIKTWRDASL